MTPLDGRGLGGAAAVGRLAPPRTKKADPAAHLEVIGWVGLLFDGPPGPAGLPFIQSSDRFLQSNSD